MEKILYIECLSGISGDMTVGALLDLGVDADYLRQSLKKLPIEGYTIEAKKKTKEGISGTDFNVILEDHDAQGHVHRNLHHITDLINNSQLQHEVKELSLQIFSRIAKAEAKVHNKSIEDVHFHEVGAIDSIVDIVGTAICIHALEVDVVFGSPLHLGTGFVNCRHGSIPVPVPATVEIIKGTPVYSKGIESELVTPTGAAIYMELVEDCCSLPIMKVQRVGYGFGTKTLPIKNMLRVYIGHREAPRDVYLLETNVDDMNPEICGYLMDELLRIGVYDVFYTPIYMKKNRPGIKISVMCPAHMQKEVESFIFTETTTLGIRRSLVDRSVLQRESKGITTKYGLSEVKIASLNGKALHYSPEYETCKDLAKAMDVPLREVYEETMLTYRESLL